MKTVTLTTEEYRILTEPTGVELWGAQQGIARKVEAQVKALDDGGRTIINAFDIAIIQTASTVLHLGGYIPVGDERSAGWVLSEWEVSARQLKRDMGIR